MESKTIKNQPTIFIMEASNNKKNNGTDFSILDIELQSLGYR